MKRVMMTILALIILCPIFVYAKSTKVEDMTIDIDDGWYVYTRDNVTTEEKEAELKELGISAEAVLSNMKQNNIYLDSIKFGEDNKNTIEMFVTLKDMKNIQNLHTYSDEDIEDLKKELTNKVNTGTVVIKDINKYKFIYANYYDEKNTLNILEYDTVINGHMYKYLAQKSNEFTDDEIKEIEKFANTIEFKLDAKYEKKPKSLYDSMFEKGIIGAIVGGVAGAIGVIFGKKKKAQENTN